MLQLPEAPPFYRIISIDPGTDTMGLAWFDLNLATFEAHLRDAQTLKAGKLVRDLPFVAETLGERHARLQTHANALCNIFYQVQPHCIISEAAYMGRFVQAFESLVEFLYMLRSVVFQYDPSLALETVDSPTAKNAVGAPGKRPKGMDPKAYKAHIGECVVQTLQQSKIQVAPQINLMALDEHSVDAIAVGCYKLRSISDTIF